MEKLLDILENTKLNFCLTDLDIEFLYKISESVDIDYRRLYDIIIRLGIECEFDKLVNVKSNLISKSDLLKFKEVKSQLFELDKWISYERANVSSYFDNFSKPGDYDKHEEIIENIENYYGLSNLIHYYHYLHEKLYCSVRLGELKNKYYPIHRYLGGELFDSSMECVPSDFKVIFMSDYNDNGCVNFENKTIVLDECKNSITLLHEIGHIKYEWLGHKYSGLGLIISELSASNWAIRKLREIGVSDEVINSASLELQICLYNYITDELPTILDTVLLN